MHPVFGAGWGSGKLSDVSSVLESSHGGGRFCVAWAALCLILGRRGGPVRGLGTMSWLSRGRQIDLRTRAKTNQTRTPVPRNLFCFLCWFSFLGFPVCIVGAFVSRLLVVPGKSFLYTAACARVATVRERQGVDFRTQFGVL